MRFPDITIAIDGFSSTGKSTLARLIAQHFDFLYLDSGAMYRGVTLFAREQGLIAPDNTIDPALEAALKTLDLHFGQGTVLFMGTRNIEKQIRTMEVSSQVSPIRTCAAMWTAACMSSPPPGASSWTAGTSAPPFSRTPRSKSS